MEMMLSRIQSEDFHSRISTLTRGSAANDTIFQQKFQKFMQESPSNPEIEELRKKQVDEQLDSKIQAAFESLRNDNLYIWKQSLELAQREFAEKGVAATMNLLPKTILDRGDLKRTVNSLILEENAVPRPQVVEQQSQKQLSAKSQPVAEEAA